MSHKRSNLEKQATSQEATLLGEELTGDVQPFRHATAHNESRGVRRISGAFAAAALVGVVAVGAYLMMQQEPGRRDETTVGHTREARFDGPEQFTFENDALGRIAEEFNRYNEDTKIYVEGGAAEKRFSGVLEADSPHSFAGAVAADVTTYEVDSSRPGSIIIRLRQE